MALPAGLNPPVNPLPFLYMSTGVETRFINGLDPEPKTRTISANLPHIHRPATLAEWIGAETLDSASLPEPHLLAQEIADDLRSALAQIEDVLGDLEQRVRASAPEEA
jgi:hypothetical protein